MCKIQEDDVETKYEQTRVSEPYGPFILEGWLTLLTSGLLTSSCEYINAQIKLGQFFYMKNGHTSMF